MSTIRKIPTSQIDGNDADANNENEIRPYGEIGLYEGNNDKLELLISDGQRTHFKSKVLAKGTFYGGDADSADGNNYDTIKLIPDVGLVQDIGTDQYIVIDPTEPNHIHIRAGGTIDNSNAELIVGGENSYLKVGSSANPPISISANNNNWIFNTSGVLELPSGGIQFSDNTLQTTAFTGQASSIVTDVFNKTGSAIPKFSVIYIDGGQGDQPTIALAVASGEMTSSKTYGITAQQIENMDTGKVIVMGALTGVNTDQFNPTSPTGDVNGTSLWLSPTTPGAVTTTKPIAPNHSVFVGTIVRTHQNEGVVEVRIQNGYEIDELHDVAISGVSHNDILVYNSGNALWENNNKGVFSNTDEIPGATGINNIVYMNQVNYDALVVKDPNTLYFIV